MVLGMGVGVGVMGMKMYVCCDGFGVRPACELRVAWSTCLQASDWRSIMFSILDHVFACQGCFTYFTAPEMQTPVPDDSCMPHRIMCLMCHAEVRFACGMPICHQAAMRDTP